MTEERRKYPARVRASKTAATATLGVIYLVEHDALTGRWNVSRGGKPTGAFARDQHTAIGQATHDAQREARETNLKVSVWSVRKGQRVKEWPAD